MLEQEQSLKPGMTLPVASHIDRLEVDQFAIQGTPLRNVRRTRRFVERTSYASRSHNRVVIHKQKSRRITQPFLGAEYGFPQERSGHIKSWISPIITRKPWQDLNDGDAAGRHHEPDSGLYWAGIQNWRKSGSEPGRGMILTLLNIV